MNEERTYFEQDFYKSFYKRFFSIQISTLLFLFLLFVIIFSHLINWSKQPLGPTLFAFVLLLLFLTAVFYIPYYFAFKGKKIRITDDGINLGKRYFGPFPSMEEISVYNPVRAADDLIVNWGDIETIVFGQSIYVHQKFQDVMFIKTNTRGIFIFTFDEFLNIFFHKALLNVRSAIEKSGRSQLIKSMDSFPYPKNIVFPLLSQKDIKRNIEGASKAVGIVVKTVFVLFLIPFVLFALIILFDTLSNLIKNL